MKNRLFSFEEGKFSGTIYLALIAYLILAMVLFSLCRVGFYLFNTSFFPDMTVGNFLHLMWGGIRFDLAAVLYINMLFIVLLILPFKVRHHPYYLRALKYLFGFTNGIALAANVADFVYYRFTLRRTTADVFLQFENEQNISGLIFHFLIDYWYGVIFWIFLVVLMMLAYNRIRFQGPYIRHTLAYYAVGIIAIPLVAGLVIAGVRGGVRHSTRPITLSNAGEYVRDPREISIVLNTPFALLRTLGKTKVQKVNFYPEEELESIYSPLHTPADSAQFKPTNVVVIILESFSKEFFGVFNKEKENGTYKGYTPFLDSLVTHSRSYEFSFANGRKSIDGLPSVVAGIPALSVPYFLSPYSTNRINSLGSLLKDKGYHSSFFHGAPNGSMGFQAFMNVAGFEHYYGMTEYANDDDFDGLWGIWDEKFLDFYANKLNEFPQPFVSSIFTVSSHHPFKVPEEYESRFKGAGLPILKCVQYTDYSLRKFFEKASHMPWYNNTLFVITADHTSSDIYFDEGRTAWGFFSVPIIFFRPDNSLAGTKAEIVQQIDIMPTILGQLGYDKPFVAFGRDAERDATLPFAFNYKDDVYQLFEGDFLLQFDGTRSVGLYNFKTDRLIRENLLKTNGDQVAVMEKKVKAIIQQYNNRMIEDRLTAKEK